MVRPVLAASLALGLVVGGGVFLMEQKSVAPQPVVVGSAVSDLQELDKNHDMLTDSDPDSASSLLDDLQVQHDVGANP